MIKANMKIDTGNKYRIIGNGEIKAGKQFKFAKELDYISLGMFADSIIKPYVFVVLEKKLCRMGKSTLLIDVESYIKEFPKSCRAVHNTSMQQMLFSSKERTSYKMNNHMYLQFFTGLESTLLEKYKSRCIIYVESFGIKSSFATRGIFGILEKLGIIFNLGEIKNINFDYCLELATDKNEYLTMDQNFVQNIQPYRILGKGYLSNFNSKLRRIISGKLIIDNPLFSKINFYNKMVYNLVSKDIRRNKFPNYAFSHFSRLLSGEDLIFDSILMESLALAVENMGSNKLTGWGLRMEVAAPARSFLSIFANLENTKTTNLLILETEEVYSSMRAALGGLLDVMVAKNCDACMKLKGLLIAEIFTIEWLVRGGKNMHILPGDLKCKFERMLLDPDQDIVLDSPAMLEISKKLILYKKGIADSTRALLTRNLPLLFLEDPDVAAEIFVDEYKSDMRKMLSAEELSNPSPSGNGTVYLVTYIDGLSNIADAIQQATSIILLRILKRVNNMNETILFKSIKDAFLKSGIRFVISLRSFEKPKRKARLVKYVLLENMQINRDELAEKLKLHVRGEPYIFKDAAWDPESGGRLLHAAAYCRGKYRHYVDELLKDIRFFFFFTHNRDQLYLFIKKMKIGSSYGRSYNAAFREKTVAFQKLYNPLTVTIVDVKDYVFRYFGVILDQEYTKIAETLINFENYVQNNEFTFQNCLDDVADDTGCSDGNIGCSDGNIGCSDGNIGCSDGNIDADSDGNIDADSDNIDADSDFARVNTSSIIQSNSVPPIHTNTNMLLPDDTIITGSNVCLEDSGKIMSLYERLGKKYGLNMDIKVRAAMRQLFNSRSRPDSEDFDNMLQWMEDKHLITFGDDRCSFSLNSEKEYES